jgi:hypothetical protein
MDFWEIVGATALGATAPVILSRYLDYRANRRENRELMKTGLGRYMSHVLGEVDKDAGDLADRMKSGED